ncbi:SDR family oxidoreductase [Micrococcaceae bacterium Sec5.7]
MTCWQAGIRSRFGRLDASVNNAAGGGPLMREAADGAAIVKMSSTAGEQGVAGLSGYVASKFGIGGLTRVAALDYAAYGIRVNAIAPGPILTGRLAAAGEAVQTGASAAVPLRRVGRVEEIAAAALWLCSGASSFVTGTVRAVDGGRLAGTLRSRSPRDPPAGHRLKRTNAWSGPALQGSPSGNR